MFHARWFLVLLASAGCVLSGDELPCPHGRRPVGDGCALSDMDAGEVDVTTSPDGGDGGDARDPRPDTGMDATVTPRCDAGPDADATCPLCTSDHDCPSSAAPYCGPERVCV